MWFYVALSASLVSAIATIYNKKILDGISSSVLFWCTLVLSTPFIAFFAIKEGIPSFNLLFVLGIIGSVLFYTTHKLTQFRAMKLSDLSEIYPLVSLGPIFTLFIAFSPPLNERPSSLAIIGLIITLFGVYFLNATKAKENLLKPIKLLFTNKASALMMISVLVDSVVIIFDKIAINNITPKNTTFVVLVENILIILGFLPVLYLRNRNFTKEIFSHKKIFIVLALLNVIGTILAFSAVGGGNVAIVATIFRAQIVFVLLLSYLFLKDKPRSEIILGTLIMIVGVVLIKIGS